MDRRLLREPRLKPGPYAYAEQFVDDNGEQRIRHVLTEEGKFLLERWLQDYPYQIKLYYSVFRDRYQAIHKSGVSYEELNAAALTGAAKAMLYWDPERCVFSTYAFHWIRQSIDRLDHVYDQAKRFKHGVAIVSANTKLKAGEDRELLDLLGTTDSHDHDLTELGFEIREALRKQVASPRYREMFTQYHGLETGVPMTLEEVANLHGLTRERVRQIISRTKQMIYPDLFGLHRKYILGNT